MDTELLRNDFLQMQKRLFLCDADLALKPCFVSLVPSAASAAEAAVKRLKWKCVQIEQFKPCMFKYAFQTTETQICKDIKHNIPKKCLWFC